MDSWLKKIAQTVVIYGAMVFFALVGGCSSKNTVFTVGIDPTWYPLETANKDPYVLAFCHELLQKIAHVKKCEFVKVSLSWDNLLDALHRQEVQGVLCSLQPQVFNIDKYQFSEKILYTGPVLVVQANAILSEIETLSEKEVAVFSQDDEQYVIEKHPDALMRVYSSVQKALADLAVGSIDAVLTDYLQAISYVGDIYQGQLKIVSHEHTLQGVRCVILAKGESKLIQLINEGLKELKASGEYDALLKKWKLSNFHLSAGENTASI